LPTNAILYWNTLKITEIVDNLRTQGEDIDKEPLAHISLLSFRHVVPNGTYFIEDVQQYGPCIRRLHWRKIQNRNFLFKCPR